jgi:hypothetical protein
MAGITIKKLKGQPNPHDKSCKLPKFMIVGVNFDGTPKVKKLWKKGKSKFLAIRLFEEKKDNINDLLKSI